jgi:signal transduction histidine kinase
LLRSFHAARHREQASEVFIVPIRLKLVLAFNVFLVVLAAIGLLTYWQLHRAQESTEEVKSRSIVRAEHSAHIPQELGRLRSLELAYTLESDPLVRRETGDQLTSTRRSIEEHIAEYKKTFTDEPAPPAASQFEQEYESYLTVHENILRLADEGAEEEAMALHIASGGEFQGLTDTAHTMRHNAHEDAVSLTGEAASLIKRTQYVIIGGLLATALLIFAIGHPLASYINNRLRSLLDATERVGRGELDQSVDTTGRDEFAALAQAFDRMVDSLRSARDEVSGLHTQTQKMWEERITLLQERMTQVVKAQEEERERVARELHDQAGQTLTALQLGLSHIEASGPTDEIKQTAASLRQLALETMHIIRNLALDLRPSALDELGLPDALQHFTETFAGRTSIRAKVEVSGSPRRLPAETEVSLFRITQEALTNVAKHAEADLVTVRLAFNGSSVRLTIEDDGVGFDVQRALGAEQRKSLGLVGMQERCHLIGGQLQIRSRPGKGTSLVIKVSQVAGKEPPAQKVPAKVRQARG